ncbi:hypothetical protein DVK85_02240 [Flavobacterium arcticum]|uniref:Porin family protein n=1 Tax=Flavobacterium arcticum TaxID=1784713 RepID=A0A345H949_9FLAO|nr:hypothetical protein [Flavobacterium arcticum]AXG73109.1 hypothetical protein DVK85_02240 [Flavobacterium arcticum]KAF2512901.1 porin family protein [Flavobacterium arcticum]
MKKIILLVLFLSLCFSTNAQKKLDQYSLEAGYGLGISGAPGITEVSHFEVGFRYMVDEYWGIKFDFGADKFRTGNNPELGTDYKRYSVQGVYNLGRAIAITDYANGYINMLAHGGIGYSSLKSINSDSDADKIGNVILGVTPQFYISDSFALTLDTSLILNFSQHYDFDGTYPEGRPTNNAFTGTIVNVSLGVTYYFGKNKNGTDWN